jgi:prevent-host-death family protein
MQSVRLTDAQSRLPALIDAVARGEEIVITRDDVPVARLTPPTAPASTTAGTSLRDHQSVSLGRLIDRPSTEDDVLAEMLDDRG